MNKSIPLFLLGCMPARLAVTYIAFSYRQALPIMGYIALIVSLGFAVIYLGGLRKTGPEVFGKKIWWNSLRPVHASLYFLFALLAIQKHAHAWVVLALDALVGLVAFVLHHTMVSK